MRKMLWLLALISAARSIPVDNGVVGEPEIECGTTSITVNFNTRNEFEGQVYVKGLFAEGDCKNEDGGRRVAGIELPFDSCNTRRQRSLNPKGVFVQTTVFISFHPRFITKVDRAYRIQCFYMEADKTVSTEIDVSMLTTAFRTQNVPMPICRYELFRAGTDDKIEFAVVGEPIDHRWTCDTETVDTFCMAIHSCFVSGPQEDRVELINFLGCATDLNLLTNPEYTTDLTASVEAHVFKFADKPQLFFECEINILAKEPNDECPRPNCEVPAGRGAGSANQPKGPLPANPSKHVWPVGPGPYTILEPIFGIKGVPGAVAPLVRTPAPIGPDTPGFEVFRGKRSVDSYADVGIVDVAASLDATGPTIVRPPLLSPREVQEQQHSAVEAYCFPSAAAITIVGSLAVAASLGLFTAIILHLRRSRQHKTVYSLAILQGVYENS